jgi:hypothetical protein
MIIEIKKSITHGETAKCRCDYCGKEFSRGRTLTTNKKHQFCCFKCYSNWYGENHKHSAKTIKLLSLINEGSGNGHWQGGKKIQHGYVMIKKRNHPSADANGYIQEHRLVMEKLLNRYLTPEEVVHHINGIRNDNRIENLLLIDCQANHAMLHKELEKVV